MAAARAEGIARDGPAPDEEQSVRLVVIGQAGPRRVETPRPDLLEPWADRTYRRLAGDRLQLTRIPELLALRGCAVSYPSRWRFVDRRHWRRRSKTTVRMADTAPGEVAEADFGRLGMIPDPATGKRKAVWAMVIVLCHSRHCFVWPLQRQKLEDVIAGLEAAWAFFGGMLQYLVIDNFPAAVVGADTLDPRFTQGFLEYARHRGFIPDLARKGRPRDQYKVERNVPYARERFCKGSDRGDFTHVRAAAPRGSAQKMLPLGSPDRIHVAFDDHRLVANAGLLLPVTLAHHWLAGQPDQLAASHRAFAAYARHDYAKLSRVCDFSCHDTVLDAGGSTGELAFSLLPAHPDMTATVMDRPEVGHLYNPPRAVGPRCRFVAGDLFREWPVQSGAVFLARVLHDWPDDDARRILGRAREAMPAGGWLYVVEMTLDEATGAGGLLDLNMLVMTGGRERTVDEFRALLVDASFRLCDVRPTGTVNTLIIAEAK